MSNDPRVLKAMLDAQHREDDVPPMRVYETGEWNFGGILAPELPGVPCVPSVNTDPAALLNNGAPKPWAVRVAKRGGKHHIIDEVGSEVCTVLTGETDAFLIAQAVNAYRDLLENAESSDAIIAAQRARILELERRGTP